MTMIRLLIVDDHQLMRDGLVRLLSLEPDVEVVGTACDGKQAVEMVRSLNPSLVLMDIRMPELSGIQATKQIKAEHPETEIVLLTMHDEDDYVFEGIGAGASGYLLKDASREELISTLHQVHAGQARLTPSVTRRVMQEFASLQQGRKEKPAASSRPEELSRREMDVLALVVQGLSNKQIAKELFIDETTVKTHLHRIFEKLDVRDRTQLAILALQKGWCQAPA
jgi:DNA-binding NarL/FixJ family response regulator